MKIPNPLSRRSTGKLNVPVLGFVGEQDGPAERLVKAELCELFEARKTLLRAYLARVHYGDTKVVSVCLCLTVTDGDDKEVVEAIHCIFSRQFNREVHLDIVFLQPKQENELSAVCKPFYRLG